MIAAADLVLGLNELGVTCVAGVPCSYLTPVINRVISDPAVRYLTVTQEGEAAAIAAGAWLGGGLGCVISQNSGLGNMVNPLTSLLSTARIPALLLVTWRGRPGEPDEPQHELMGRITEDLLELCEVEHSVLSGAPHLLPTELGRAREMLSRQFGSYAFVLPDGTVAPEPLQEREPAAQHARPVHRSPQGPAPTRFQVLERLLEQLPDQAAVISTTGKTSRELFTLADREQHFYLVGAMGSAATVGLGLALHSSRPVVVVDGDGALLMRLGSLATLGAHAPGNLVHVVLDNGVHDSTGGQRTLAAVVDFPAVAAACGYAEVHSCGSLDHLGEALRPCLKSSGPSLIHVRTLPGSPPKLGRPNMTPVEVSRRFRDFVTAPIGK